VRHQHHVGLLHPRYSSQQPDARCCFDMSSFRRQLIRGVGRRLACVGDAVFDMRDDVPRIRDMVCQAALSSPTVASTKGWLSSVVAVTPAAEFQLPVQVAGGLCWSTLRLTLVVRIVKLLPNTQHNGRLKGGDLPSESFCLSYMLLLPACLTCLSCLLVLSASLVCWLWRSDSSQRMGATNVSRSCLRSCVCHAC